ncbi:unnamed protein product [Parascedosporium putredinis]|uniref:Helicase C-terminal domain-containing protein n=1 Tax=Parascedosporium putredinis TaxID=1442378 RepID=A0A9P1GVD3_9PEZI|nr:unnamed protein product [Parascedosporium putredinis]CAI7988377.1 unnamed protein product [Parascedosporium putredinis]
MFRDDPTAKVLIASLLCGGQSLNITAANRVILTELWWNTPAEEQAFARVHRFGQTKEIHLVRLRCPGTRDDDILQMQASKDAELSSCLMSKKSSLVGRPIVDDEGTIIGIERPKEGGAPCDIDDELYSLASDGGDPASDSGDEALGFD